MLTGYELLDEDEAKLNFLLTNESSPKSIRAHYRKRKPLYKIWFDDIADDQIASGIIDDTGENVYIFYKPPKVIELLCGRIKGFDKELIVLMSVKKIKEDVGMDHEQVCKLFAKNVAAPNNVKEIL